jgi:hypothetical protein
MLHRVPPNALGPHVMNVCRIPALQPVGRSDQDIKRWGSGVSKWPLDPRCTAKVTVLRAFPALRGTTGPMLTGCTSPGHHRSPGHHCGPAIVLNSVPFLARHKPIMTETAAMDFRTPAHDASATFDPIEARKAPTSSCNCDFSGSDVCAASSNLLNTAVVV